MSDLQCPARFLVLGRAGAGYAASDAAAVEPLLAHLRAENVAALYVEPDLSKRGRALSSELSAELRVRAVEVDGLEVDTLDDLADRHRGESVLVLVGEPGLDPADVALVEVDADGRRTSHPWAQNRRAPTSSMPRSAS